MSECAQLFDERVHKWLEDGKEVTAGSPAQEKVSGVVRGFVALISTEVTKFRNSLDAFPVFACMHPEGAFDIGYLTWAIRPEKDAIRMFIATLRQHQQQVS